MIVKHGDKIINMDNVIYLSVNHNPDNGPLSIKFCMDYTGVCAVPVCFDTHEELDHALAQIENEGVVDLGIGEQSINQDDQG